MHLPRLVPVILCSTVALVGCGGSGLLDGSSAEDLQSSIARVKAAVVDGRCDEALSAARQGLERVDDLPSSVDQKLVTRLRDGFQELEDKIPTDCSPVETTTTPEPTTETTPTEPEPPVTTETTPTETTPTTPTEPQTTTPTETTPTTEDPSTTPDDGESGGTPPVDETDEDSPATPRSLRELEDAGRDARKRVERALREARKALRGDR